MLKFLVMTATLTSLTLSASAREIVVGTGEFPPFTTDQGPDQGCALEIVKSAYAEEGWDVNVLFMPWPRTLKLLSSGMLDASAIWADREDRRQEYLFSEYWLTNEEYRFVMRADSQFDWKTIADFSGKTIIVNRSYSYTEAFWDDLRDYNVDVLEVESEDDNLTTLLRGRGDITILQDKVMRHYLKQLPPSDQSKLTVDDKVALTVKGFLIFSKNDIDRAQAFLNVFDRGFEKIRHEPALVHYFEVCNSADAGQ